MGLDMYLKAKIYVPPAQYANESRRYLSLISKVQDIFGLSQDAAQLNGLSFEVGYWRKANHIHKWFVDNVQDGVDDCREYEVSGDDLKKLRLACVNTLDNRAHIEAGRIGPPLPPCEGFFFGSTEIDDGYFGDVEDTIKIIDRTLALPIIDICWFTYRSSW